MWYSEKRKVGVFMAKTIKEIAEEIGVTPQAIYQRKKQEPLSTSLIKHVEKKGNTVYIDEVGEALILQAFQVETLKRNNQQIAKEETVVERLLTALEKELSEKNKTIEAQQETIKELSTALQAMTENLNKSQALHAGTIQSQLEAQSQNTPPETSETPSEGESAAEDIEARTEEKTPSKGFWGRIFQK